MKRAFVWMLCIVLFETMLCADAFAIRANNPPPKSAAHVASIMPNLGTGPDALIALRLRDKTVLSGYVAQAGTDSLLVVDPDNRREQTVYYTQIDRLQGYNLVTGVEVHQGVGLRAKLVRAVTHIIRPMPVNNLTKRDTLIVGIVIGILLAIILSRVL